MRLLPPPPPESNAYLIIGNTATLLGIAIIYGSIHPSRYVQAHPNTYRNPSIFGGVVWLAIGLMFLVPAIVRKIRR